MKYAFISDIHGNTVALEAVLKDISMKNVDKIIVLGDLCFRGPEPKKALDMIRSLETDVIKGNADEWVIRGVKVDEVPDHALNMMNKERNWCVSQLDKNDMDFLLGLPHSYELNIEAMAIEGFHATPNSLFDIVLPHTDDDTIYKKLMSSKAKIFIYGHIHTPFIRYINGKVIINTGSVGLPFDGLAKASYAIVEITSGNFRTSIERVDFDIEKVVSLYESVRYPNAETMIRILKSGVNS